jgi:hypothetical protein
MVYCTFMVPPGSTKEMAGMGSKMAMVLVYSIWGRISNFVWALADVLQI